MGSKTMLSPGDITAPFLSSNPGEIHGNGIFSPIHLHTFTIKISTKFMSVNYTSSSPWIVWVCVSNKKKSRACKGLSTSNFEVIPKNPNPSIQRRHFEDPKTTPRMLFQVQTHPSIRVLEDPIADS